MINNVNFYFKTNPKKRNSNISRNTKKTLVSNKFTEKPAQITYLNILDLN